ncbi:ATP-binding cassette domain-containing protein [Dactylosporangium sp. NPDC051541]|uniref:ATP-binding cassette domain-containing protein n=1 Tax=Dactylosporangium sp. NPDC051541 TaxID=3363977 RepID=UPI0037BD9805
MTALVDIKGLDIGYRRGRAVVPAVAGLDLTVGAGEVVALVGESGSGKTTTANALIGLLPAGGRITAGSALVDGVQIAGARERTLRRLRGSVVGLIPQDPMVSLNPTKRIGAQVAEACGPGEVAHYLEQAGIPDPELRRRQYPHQLSGGLRQRVLIAIALAGRPKLIIADEPTSALDVTVQRRILDHLGGLVREQGISLLIITHDLAVAADRADRVVVLKGGVKVEEGTPGTILTAPRAEYTRQLIAAVPRLEPRADIPPPAPPILVLERVHKTFAGGFDALSDVSVTVSRGQTHALVGESGCGKSTTLRIALGLEAATSGSIVLDGTEIAGLPWSRARPLRRKAQLVHQDPFAALDPRFTVRQTVTEPLVAFRIGDRRSRTARARELLDQVALPSSFLERRPTELSGGQRQRVAIARSLALHPELLMLDEPVSALDVLVQDQILRLLVELQQSLGLSYLFVSHDLAVVAQIAHTVSVMRGGRIVEEGPVATVFTDPRSEHTRELIAAVPGRASVRAHA